MGVGCGWFVGATTATHVLVGFICLIVKRAERAAFAAGAAEKCEAHNITASSRKQRRGNLFLEAG